MAILMLTKTNKLMLRCNNCTLDICKHKEVIKTKLIDVAKLSVFWIAEHEGKVIGQSILDVEGPQDRKCIII